MAACALPILFVEIWTIVAWLASGPRQVTEFQTPHSGNWYAAKTFEAAAILVAVAVAVYVVRGCLRERKLLTFDVMFCLCGATLFWVNLTPNFFNPVLLMSSNFVNVTDLCGHIPFVINPDCSRSPHPILFFWLIETFGMLGGAIAVSAGIRWLRARRPGLSTSGAVGAMLAAGLVLELSTEGLAAVIGLWVYQLNDAISFRFGNGLRFPPIEGVIGACFFASLMALRFFRDDKGQTVLERGLSGRRPGGNRAVTLLAMYAVFQVLGWVVNVPIWFLGQYQSPWRPLPAYLVNGICDAPGTEGTRYGPCPGDPDYRMPGRRSLR